MTKDEKYIARCIQLAKNGLCNAAPNPMVGAVIVHNDTIIGEGYHIRCGEAHAEVNAVRSVKDESLLKESTIYVSLEPCSHHGKTPPCADLIINKGIPRVVVGCQDAGGRTRHRQAPRSRNRGQSGRTGRGMQATHPPFRDLQHFTSSFHYLEMGRIGRRIHRPPSYGRPSIHFLFSPLVDARSQAKSRTFGHPRGKKNGLARQSFANHTELVWKEPGANGHRQRLDPPQTPCTL